MSLMATFVHVYITIRTWGVLTPSARGVQVSFALILVWVGYGTAESLRTAIPLGSRVFLGIVVFTCLLVSLGISYAAERPRRRHPRTA